ncbi:MAG TPA: ELWxxDGT repeat protein, partial [Cytophagales bacterium]
TLVKDISSGKASGLPLYYERSKMAIVNGTLYFAADDGLSGQELWKSDGTAAGTGRVIDGNPGPGSSSPDYLTNLNGTLCFTAQATFNGSTGSKIWKSDGTESGTVALADPGQMDNAYYLVAVGNVLYFSAFKFSSGGLYGEVGAELWRSDGTAAGTLLVQDSFAGPEGSWPASLTNVNGTLYFAAIHEENGAELWKYSPATCVTPNVALAVTGSTVCGNNPASVRVKGTQTGVTYRLYLNNSPVGEPVAGGGDISIALPGNLLVPATYALTVRASGCVEVPLAQQALLAVIEPVAPPTVSAVAVNRGDAALLTAGGAPAGGTYRWYGAAVGGTLLATGATYTTPSLWANATYYVSIYLNAGCESARVPVPVSIHGGGPLRVNTGGGTFTTPEGNVFGAEAYFTGGTVSAITGGEVAGTPNDALYHNLRVGAGFSYALPTGNGLFDVTLHFNETYWGYRTTGGAGSRQFNVDLEGSRRLTNYDIFAAAGGAMRARTETFRVRVADGTLNIVFGKGLADNPAIAAIEAVPAGPSPRINAGGPAYVTAGGQTFIADAYFTGGSVSALAAGEVANTTEDALYRTIRFGSSFAYNIPVSNATYGVLL